MNSPTVGATVHYVSYGTPGGEYGKECRAAVVTEVSPGFFFNRGCVHHEADPHLADSNPAVNHPGGTWHWPEGSA